MSNFFTSMPERPESLTGTSHAMDGASVDGGVDVVADADTAALDVAGRPTARVEATARISTLRRLVRSAIALAIVAAVTVTLRVSGTLTDIDTTLQVMGFDPDRARLLADLAAAAVIVSSAALVTGAGLVAGLAGAVAGGALFAGAFVSETRAAMHAVGAAGAFDPGGWWLTLVTLAVAFLVIGWAAAALTLIVRRWILRAGSDAAVFVRGEHRLQLLARAVPAILVLALLGITLPVFGDMVNYTPDVRMQVAGVVAANDSAGAGAGEGAGQAAAGDPGQAAAGDPRASQQSSVALMPTPSILPGSDSVTAASTGSPGRVIRTGTPWAVWRASGRSRVTSMQLPAPWTGGTRSSAIVDVYTPPGYGTTSRTYPTLYALPWGITGGWTTSVHIQQLLDSLITSGTIPAQVVVFASALGGPFPDSECVNSADGRQSFDSYIVNRLVPFIDLHYQTIRTAAARATMGFSQGGFCASMLLFRHPEVFSSAISFSGYYQAGIRSTDTPNAWRPFGDNASYEAAWSPLTLAGQIPAATRSSMFMVMEADPTEAFFGPQYNAMVTAAHAGGVSLALLPSGLGHSWAAPRNLMGKALVLVADRQNASGVFG